MKILNFGSCNIDYVYSLDHIVQPGETETTHNFKIFSGGKGLNQSVAAAKAGSKVYHAGCIGSDGEMLEDILKENGVDISYLKKLDSKTGHAIIQVSVKGENSIFLYPGSNEKVTKEWIDEVLDNFGEGDILLLQNEISNVSYIVEKAYEKNMCIVFNPSPFNEKINLVDINKISYLVVNEVEAKEFSGSELYDESIEFFKANYPNLKVMLTLGSRGCVFSDKDNRIYQPSYLVDAVDTTAAGDTFTGYFVSEIARGEEYADILKIASAAAAISVTREGAAPSIPKRQEVLEKIKDLKTANSNKNADYLKEQIEKYIEDNIQSASLSELSEKLGYSFGYAGSLVKKLFGEPFSKIVQNKRCAAACRLLRETDLSIEEIIRNAGYENESFFRKIFKENIGVNPLEYRKNHSL